MLDRGGRIAHQSRTGRHRQLQLHQIDPGGRLGHGVLERQPGLEPEDGAPAIGRVPEERHRPGTSVAGHGRQAAGRVAEAAIELVVEPGRRRLHDHALSLALEAAVADVDHPGGAVPVGDHLHLEPSGPVDREARRRHRHARLVGDARHLGRIAQPAHGGCVGADEGDAPALAALDEVGAIGQDAPADPHGVGLGLDEGPLDGVEVDVVLGAGEVCGVDGGRGPSSTTSSASRTNMAWRSASALRATVVVGGWPSAVRSRTAWMTRIAGSPRSTMANRPIGRTVASPGPSSNPIASSFLFLTRPSGPRTPSDLDRARDVTSSPSGRSPAARVEIADRGA